MGKIKNAILVLANNMDYFNLMVENLPLEEMNNILFIVVNEIRIGDKTKEIEKIIKKYNIPNYKILKSNLINDKFKEEIINNKFVESYTMSMNILSLWFVYKYNKNIEKILLLDDDVILRKNFSKIFESNHHLFKHTRLSAGLSNFYKQSKNSQDIFKEWFRIFNIDFTEELWKNIYLKKYINSGQRMIVKDKFDIKNYEKKTC